MQSAIPDIDVDRLVKDAGGSKTVYALVTPETEAAKHLILGNCSAEPDAVRRIYLEQFRDAWTGKQFTSHEILIERWAAWAAPMVAMSAADFRWRYPTAGASEALFHLVAQYGNRARRERFDPEVHVFAGEYEGYRAYAEACGIAVVEHARADWETVASELPASALFCLSQPSAIDGNVWGDANAFLALVDNGAEPRVLLDLTYVGATAELPAQRIFAGCGSVLAITFSLSKPFGVYYDRIGGVLCRHPVASLLGNQWFKNLTSLQLGAALIEHHAVLDLPRKYKRIQQEALLRIGRSLGLTLRPSDVYVLATAIADSSTDPQLAAFLRRPAGNPDATLRICLTPAMAQMIGTAGPIAIAEASQ